MIISILFLTESIYCNIFTCNYLRKEKLFLHFFFFFFAFSKFRFNCERFQNKDDPHSWWIFELTDHKKRCLLSADNKYSLLNIDNLLQHFRMQLSQKRKIVSAFFFFFLAFSKFKFNFEQFQKEDDPHSWCIFKFTNSEIRR